MWYFERFDLCKSLVTYQNNYTERERESYSLQREHKARSGSYSIRSVTAVQSEAPENRRIHQRRY